MFLPIDCIFLEQLEVWDLLPQLNAKEKCSAFRSKILFCHLWTRCSKVSFQQWRRLNGAERKAFLCCNISFFFLIFLSTFSGIIFDINTEAIYIKHYWFGQHLVFWNCFLTSLIIMLSFTYHYFVFLGVIALCYAYFLAKWPERCVSYELFSKQISRYF